MKAMVMHDTNTPLVLEDLELDPPGPGELLLRIEAAGLCHSDLHYLWGDFPVKSPIVLGHEGVGAVEAVGEGVSNLTPGDRVALLWRPRCGVCEFCLSGRPALCPLGRIHAAENVLWRGGTRLHKDGVRYHHLMGDSCFAEQAVVSAESVVKIDAEVPSQVAAIAGCAVITGMGAIINRMPDLAGKSLAIIGAGGVGLAAVLAAELVGARQIIVSDLVDARLDKATEVGATHTINSGKVDFAQTVQELTDGGAHYVLEAIGNQATIRAGFDALRPGGTEVVIGLGRVTDTFTLPINQLVQGEKRVVGSLYGSSNSPLQLPEILRLYQDGRLPLEKLLGRSFALAETNEAIEHLRGGAVGRVTLIP